MYMVMDLLLTVNICLVSLTDLPLPETPFSGTLSERDENFDWKAIKRNSCPKGNTLGHFEGPIPSKENEFSKHYVEGF